jgi:L-asparagine oxygenase
MTARGDELDSVMLTHWSNSFAPAPLSPDAAYGDPASLNFFDQAFQAFPEHVRATFSAFRSAPSVSGALLVRGLPLGQLPATPPSPDSILEKDRNTETLLLAAASGLGFPVGYAPEHGGDLVQNIVPVLSTTDRQVSTSSKVRLEFHTEAAFHPHRPRYLLLLCLRGDPAAATTLSSIREAVSHLAPQHLAVLREPRFATGVDESYLGYRSEALGSPFPALAGGAGGESVCFDGDLMQGLDPEAVQALEGLRSALDAVQRAIVLETGDLLVIDNHVAVHGRSPFTPRFDGTDRWLQRSFVLDALDRSTPDRVGRVIATKFDTVTHV